MFFATRNLVEKSILPSAPWDFSTPKPGLQICKDKIARQEFYQNISTDWQFYTGIEASNPNQRASKDNPPRFLHGVVADYDLPVSNELIAGAINGMKIKPQYVERSLGGNARLVWVFPRPLPVDTTDFCVFLLDKAVTWLSMELLPGLDSPAVRDPHRLFCNGGAGSWVATGLPGVTEVQLQSFFCATGSEFRFNPVEGPNVIPFSEIEKAIVAKYPNFTWPVEFAPETQGPSFWIAGSESSMSAIAKQDGIFTFSSHAAKPFYSWADILGPTFAKETTDAAIAKATTDVWWDEKRFWRKKKGSYTSMDAAELTNHFKCECGLSLKPGKDGTSNVDRALNHIYSENYIVNAAPYVFQSSGLLVYHGKRRLNTYIHNILQPSEGIHEWGATGSFPFLSQLLDNLFDPTSQLPHFLAWWKHFYTSGLNLFPTPGQVVFLMGGVGVGKTFLNREMVGASVGGFVDAAAYIIKAAEFNYHLFEVPHWCVDDDTINDSPQAQQNVQAVLKKSVANNDFLVNKKFHNSGMTSWSGRIMCSTNLDYISSRMLGPLDNSSLDKISVFRCARVPRIVFPSRPEMAKLTAEQLPNLLAWLVAWEPPAEVTRDNRFGFAAYQETSLMEQATQTSKVAPFKEILLDLLTAYFKENPSEMEWKGTVTRLLQTIHANPMNDCIIRTLRLEQVNRYLEGISKEGILNCRTETGNNNVRVWVFDRPKKLTISSTAETPLIVETGLPNKFEKI